MEVKQLYFRGYKGEILEEVKAPIKRPILEVDSDQKLDFKELSFSYKLSFRDIRSAFTPAYKEWGRFGYMGDILSIKVIKINGAFYYFLDYIGRLAVNKPGLAVDLFLFIRISSGTYFVGIRRKNEPGKGMLASMGGFIDIRGYHYDTPIETVIHEAEEEIGLKIEVDNGWVLKSYELVKASVKVDFHEKKIPGTLVPVGIFPTGDSENILSTGLKRVYTTTAFVLSLDMSEHIPDESGISNWLKAGDDAASLVTANIEDGLASEFGLEHHLKIYGDAMAVLDNIE